MERIDLQDFVIVAVMGFGLLAYGALQGPDRSGIEYALALVGALGGSFAAVGAVIQWRRDRR